MLSISIAMCYVCYSFYVVFLSFEYCVLDT
jgi:hypothetical protein